ncbi:MAG: hypothetical protein WBO35_04145, partial [Candidatus Saccharimonadales bacterium]
FIKAVAEKGAEIQLIDAGYFGIPQAETALDRGLADVNAELRKECAELRSDNRRLTMALEAISGTIAIYRAHQP